MIDLSIIIPSWNAKQYLQKCIESIIKDTRNYQIEIIVVDNASTDGSQELVRQQYPHVKFIRNDTNLGFAKANNIGISHSTGDYVCLINSDVDVLQGCFRKMIAHMEQNPAVGILGPQILDLNSNIQRSTMSFPTLWNTYCRALALDTLFPKSQLFGGYLMTFWSHNTIREVDVINGCFWMVRREALTQVGSLDERFFIYAEDMDWCKRFLERGWKVIYYPEAKVIHYGGASSSNAPAIFYIEMLRSNIQFWGKYHSRQSLLVYLLLIGLHHIIRLFGQFALYILSPSIKNQTLFKIKRNVASIKWLLSFNFDKRIRYDN